MEGKPTGVWHKARDNKPNTGCIAGFAKHTGTRKIQRRLSTGLKNSGDCEISQQWMFTSHIVLSGFQKQSCCFVDQVGNPLKATNSFVQLVLSKEINWNKINTVPQSMWRASERCKIPIKNKKSYVVSFFLRPTPRLLSGFVFVKWQRIKITRRMMPKKTSTLYSYTLFGTSRLPRCCPRICQCVAKKVLHHILDLHFISYMHLANWLVCSLAKPVFAV